MRRWLAGGLAVVALIALTGCGNRAERTVTVTDTAPAVASTSDDWTEQAVAETLAEYQLDIAQHCLAVVRYRAERGPAPADESFTAFDEAISGIISIARANPTRTVDTDGASLTIGDWMVDVAGNADLCDQAAGERLRYAAQTLT